MFNHLQGGEMLLIIKDGDIMIITKQNPHGGPMIKSYRIIEDPDTGVLGYLVGYCICGCEKPVCLRSLDVRDIVNKFGWSLYEYEQALKTLKPKIPLRHRIIKMLGGNPD